MFTIYLYIYIHTDRGHYSHVSATADTPTCLIHQYGVGFASCGIIPCLKLSLRSHEAGWGMEIFVSSQRLRRVGLVWIDIAYTSRTIFKGNIINHRPTFLFGKGFCDQLLLAMCTSMSVWGDFRVKSTAGPNQPEFLGGWVGGVSDGFRKGAVAMCCSICFGNQNPRKATPEMMVWWKAIGQLIYHHGPPLPGFIKLSVSEGGATYSGQIGRKVALAWCMILGWPWDHLGHGETEGGKIINFFNQIYNHVHAGSGLFWGRGQDRVYTATLP